ncbi:Z-DNA-binding protein 1 isoform X3 [Trichechus manatus latirostris]|uniref:Z-DNA-binding protein 1 isoform X3 n=1 Tax=Trichechus manatus latirostris TaxID=127582 RepID=A0A2Y9S263_TRIMA|nr:Z-DNA-binding protein 1 isoform X3 [Trichechus manatus latirostris]
MAEAPIDPGKKGDLEQKILQVLQEAGSPVKIAQLVKKCQVSKKELNHVLYRMKAVTCTGPATWCLGGDGTRDVVPTEPAEPGPSCGYRPSEEAAQKSLQNAATIPQSTGSPLGEQRQKAIYTLLAANGPRDALSIARALGMKTAKDVNPDLYAMRSKHLLTLDQNSKSWAVYRPDAGFARCDSDFPGDVGQAAPGIITTLSSQMDTLSFGREDPTPAENRAPTEGN